jgi:hypothetical protein
VDVNFQAREKAIIYRQRWQDLNFRHTHQLLLLTWDKSRRKPSQFQSGNHKFIGNDYPTQKSNRFFALQYNIGSEQAPITSPRAVTCSGACLPLNPTTRTHPAERARLPRTRLVSPPRRLLPSCRIFSAKRRMTMLHRLHPLR